MTAFQIHNRSKEIISSQQGIHPRLQETVRRHRVHEWHQPLHQPTSAAFEALQEVLEGESRPLVLDSGCGTGKSTIRLGQQFPDSLVMGVDKSADRLQRSAAVQFPWRDKNVFLVRAELASFWRLALEAGWSLERHYLFYPNPWPKPGHLQRRWHAHPVFPTMLRLGGQLEMRTNWPVYAEEFAAALTLCLDQPVEAAELAVTDPVSPFERKYLASGHRLYSVSVSLSSSFSAGCVK